MKNITRGSIKSLKKMANSKGYASISDRIKSIIHYKKKRSFSKIADNLHRSKGWVSKWINRYKTHGIEGLFDLPRSGRPCLILDTNLNIFINRVQNGAIAKDTVSCFNCRYIRRILENEFQSIYSLSGTYGLLSRLKFTKIKPRPVHEKNDKTLMQQWKNDTLPVVIQNIQSAYPDKKIEIWFQDEMRFGEKTKTSSQWKLCGTAYTELKQLGFRNQYIYGAINPTTGAHVGYVSNSVCTEIMNIHLDLISKAVSGDNHALIIMDQARWHSKSKGLIVPPNINILNLPAYSPELNPVERLWKWLKERYLVNRFISKDENLTDIGCDVWNKLNSKTIKSLCQVSFTNFM